MSNVVELYPKSKKLKVRSKNKKSDKLYDFHIQTASGELILQGNREAFMELIGHIIFTIKEMESG